METQELFEVNTELGRLLDCRLDIFHIPYDEFKNGEYSEEIADLIESLPEPLFTETPDNELSA